MKIYNLLNTEFVAVAKFLKDGQTWNKESLGNFEKNVYDQ
jgi:hypothetical protein